MHCGTKRTIFDGCGNRIWIRGPAAQMEYRMAGQKGKSGALDAFWDTVTTPSSNSGSMSDLFESLASSSSITKGLQKKDRPARDPILILLDALLQSEPNGLTVIEIMTQTKFGPSECLDITAKAVEMGLIVQNAQPPAQMGFRLTDAGLKFARAAVA
jgi:hypothetical protein